MAARSRSSYVRMLLVAAFLAPAPAQDLAPGLIAAYRDGGHLVRLVVPAPQFYLEADESVHPSLATAFDAEWTGIISILRADRYRFETGAAEVLIDGRRVTDQPVSITAGRHPIIIRYRRKPGVAAVRLQWQASHFPLEPVPGSVFFHSAAENISSREERGRALVEELGCVNCHASASVSLHGRRGPDLSGVGSRVDGRWLVKWLADPQAFRPGAVMPAASGEQERRDVATYLSSLRVTASSARKPRRVTQADIANGTKLYGLIGCSACHQQEGLSLDGIGSKTTIEPLMDFLKNPARLDAGARMPSLLLSDDEAFQLAAFLVESKNPAFEAPLTPGDAERGRALVQSQGCLGCHALPGLENTQRAPDLGKLSPGRGCLASDPPSRAPRYRLTPDQRGAIQAFLAAYQRHPDRSPAPVYQFYQAFEQLRCVACHSMDNLHATASLPEADPALTDAGAKLRTRWLEQVITGRQRVRRWLALRMPQYDARAAGTLAHAFARASGVAPGDGPSAAPAAEALRTRAAGMIGADPKKGGLACIGCHDWGVHPSLGEEAPQLINTTERLRYDWYQRWMLDPARILSGTSMPNYFSSMDRNRAGETVAGLWAAMALGDRMPLPDGLEAAKAVRDSEALPVPDREPIVVRWDMPEATPAAIAVGLPGGLSYCFDAGESRLRYAWKGGFVDLTGTLLRKTEANRLTPTAKIVGEIIYRSDEFPLRFGSKDRVPQRRFRGYRFAGGFPELHYEAGGIDVYERIVPAKDKSGLVREFSVSRVDQPAWFVDPPRPAIEIPRGTNVRFQVSIP